jgi:hypothetical protein
VASTEGNVTAGRDRLGGASPGFDLLSGPTSLVAAEIHLGHQPAGICAS